MQRTSNLARVADDYYKNLLSYFASPTATGDGNGIPNAEANATTNLTVYGPVSPVAKKDKSRRSAEKAVHLIPLVLLLCALILWFSSSDPDDVENKEPGLVAPEIEVLKAAGVNDVDGTQNHLMPHVEFEDPNVLHNHLLHRRASERKPSI